MLERLDGVLDALRRRRSVRRFAPRAVDAADLDRILEAVRWAPSAGNRQAYRFIVVTSAEMIRTMGAAVDRETARRSDLLRDDLAGEIIAYMDNFTHFRSAPVVVVPIYRPGLDLLNAAADDAPCPAQSSAGNDALSSVCAAITYLLVAAQAEGLGACWMTGPLVAKDALRAALDVPAGWEIAAVVPIGYPAEIPEAPPRRSLGQLVRRIT